MRLNVQLIAQYVGGSFAVRPDGELAESTGFTWDSREVKPGYTYVALPGEHHDGHDFVPEALRAGAVCIIASKQLDGEVTDLAGQAGAAIIMVDDTVAAVTDLARGYRTQLQGRVIAVTGSTGKTTTKNIIRDVLSTAFSVVATKANQNNELGVPRTILSADPETQVVVVEMGMRGSGQLEELCDFVRPDWGLISNVGDCHIELLGSRENIARAKAELVASLASGTGIAFLNGADAAAAFISQVAALSEKSVETVCFDGSGDFNGKPAWCTGRAVWAEDISLDEQGCPTFTMCAEGFGLSPELQKMTCSLGLRGLHNVSNACSAAAIGLCLGMTLVQSIEALTHAEPESGRQQILQAACGATVVNDAYNANPDSMRASLRMFCSMRTSGKRIAVLGDMAELGDFAPELHRGIGELIAALPLDYLICVGDLGAVIADSACGAGMDSACVKKADTVQEVLADLDGFVSSQDAVLVKASNCMGLVRVVEGLLK